MLRIALENLSLGSIADGTERMNEPCGGTCFYLMFTICEMEKCRGETNKRGTMNC